MTGQPQPPKRPDPGDEIREAVRDVREAVGEARSALTGVRGALGGLGGLVGDVVRRVSDVDTLKAMADPTRLAILRALMDEPVGEPRVMSAKELAEELGEPQTKLYRHLKVLEAAGLIEVAETRLVSGIVETRYRAAQRDIRIDTEGPGGADLADAVADETLAALLAAGIDDFRERLAANGRRGGYPARRTAAETPRIGGTSLLSMRLSAEKAEEYNARLKALVDDLKDEPGVPDGVTVEVLLAWFGRVEDADHGRGPDRGGDADRPPAAG